MVSLASLVSQLFMLTVSPIGSRGPAVLDDFTQSYGYKFNDPAGYQWPVHSAAQNKL